MTGLTDEQVNARIAEGKVNADENPNTRTYKQIVRENTLTFFNFLNLVLLAIGLPHEIAHGSLRLTLSEETTKEDLDFTVDKLKEIVQYLRSMSPLYEDFMKNQK